MTNELAQTAIESASVRFSVVKKKQGPLTKIMRLDVKSGIVVKDGSECWMAEGKISTCSIKTLQQFATGLRKLASNQALVHGVSDYDEAYVTTKGRLELMQQERPADALPVIARSKEYIQYPDGPGLMMFDHDRAQDKATGNEPALQSYRAPELVALIAGVMPEIATAGYVSTPSTSACIFDKDGKELRGDGSGSHIYFMVENGRDIPRFLEVLGKRLILAGYGRIEVSRSGNLLLRTLVDLTVGSPERLDFAAGAVCKDGLVQKLPVPIVHYGTMLNTALLPDLTPDEELQYNSIIDGLTELARPSQAIIKEQYVDQEATKLSTEKKISIEDARTIIEARQNHILADGDQLYFQHMKGKSVTVADVLDDPASYDKKPLADPLEPEYDGGSLTKAKFYWNDGKRPMIRSYAHGLLEYTFDRIAVKIKNGRQFKFTSSSDLICAPPKWLIKNYLEEETTATFFGPPGSMKTFIVMDMGLCIATGKECHGHKVKQGTVLYVCGEGKSGIKKRIQAWERHHNMKAPLFFVSTSAAQLTDPTSLRDVEAAAQEVAVADEKPALIIIDTLNRNFGPGDENSTADMTAFIQAVDQLRDSLECAIIIVHHSGIADSNRVRGSSALKGAMDFEYICKKTGTTVEEQTVTLESTKTKDHEPPAPKTFKPCIIDLGIVDEDHNPVTSLILEQTDERPKKKKLTLPNRIALQALDSVTADGNSASETLWRNEAYAKGISSASTLEASKKAFNRSRKYLLEEGLVQTEDDLYWLTVPVSSDMK